jgi:hypothetical protein
LTKNSPIHPKVAAPTAAGAILALLATAFHVHLSTEATAAIVTAATGVIGYLTPTLNSLEQRLLAAVVSSQAPAPTPAPVKPPATAGEV